MTKGANDHLKSRDHLPRSGGPKETFTTSPDGRGRKIGKTARQPKAQILWSGEGEKEKKGGSRMFADEKDEYPSALLSI